MSSTDSSPAFDGLLELLATNADPEQVLGFQLAENNQRRLDDLLAKNRSNPLSEADRAELDSFEQLEHVVGLLKAKMYGRLNQ